jgi:methyl-accepting chemotaxis protein
MEDMRGRIGQTENFVTRSLLLTEEARGSSHEKERTLDRLQKAMDAIKHSNALLAELRASFQAIHAKTRKINDIVAKTQLLSFNASIEAARAGQFGKGFSVVAEEVGRLAQSSGHAAKEIESLVVESEIKARSIVDMMLMQTDEGVAVASRVKSSFSDMVDGINRIAESLSQISHSTHEQAVGMDQAVHGIDRINQSIIKNRRSVDEIVRISQTPVNQSASISSTQIGKLLDSLTGEAPKNSNSEGPRDTKEISADDPSFKPQE